MDLPRPRSSTALWWGLGAFFGALMLWIGFFDSHSLLRRYQWHQQHEALQQENLRLRRDIDRLQQRLDRPLTDSMVERIAREEYGMKRPDERVYRIEED